MQWTRADCVTAVAPTTLVALPMGVQDICEFHVPPHDELVVVLVS